MSERYDDAVVGAGIMGLAHAYALARRGRRVIVFERNRMAMGASVRNFGMLWPIGQPSGLPFLTAMKSRAIWLKVLEESGLWHNGCGSYHLAHHPLEAAVLTEFESKSSEQGYRCEWHNASQVSSRAPLVNPEKLIGGLFSETEICIDPREVMASLPVFLQQRYQVDFHFNTAVTSYEQPEVRAGGQTFTADKLFVCSGEDFQTLYPDAFASSGLYRVKLQMMRSQAFGYEMKIGPMLAAGLTLCHYRNFQDCPSLPELRQHFRIKLPDYVKYGIHVMASQHAGGEITIGDSHEYDDAIQPFDREEINELILAYLNSFLILPQLRIVERWNGVYAAHKNDLCWTSSPAPGVRIVASPSGRGMTMSFGIAEREVENLFGEI